MRIEYKGTLVKNIIDWGKIIFKSENKKKHWELGRSAYSLADFILNKNGVELIKSEVVEVLKEDVIFDVAYPEYEVRFDNFGKGREHDLGIYGKTDSGKTVFIGLEAKVDETFGDTISTAYLNAKIKELNGENTNAPKRIENLLTRHFKQMKKDFFNLRYQLLYSTVGTISVSAEIHVLFVLVFKTSLSDVTKIAENKKDYLRFFKNINDENISNNDNFEVFIEGEKLSVIYKMIDF